MCIRDSLGSQVADLAQGQRHLGIAGQRRVTAGEDPVSYTHLDVYKRQVDPWYPLGNGNILRILEAGLHICHMLGYEDLKRSLDLITDNSARALNLGEGYGLEVGRPANLLILSAPDDYEMVRSQGHALVSVRHGKVLMRRTPASIERG